MNDFNEWLVLNTPRFHRENYTTDEIANLALACGFSKLEVDQWKLRRDSLECRHCGFSACPHSCTFHRCQRIREKGFCTAGCEQGFKEIREYERERVKSFKGELA